MIPNPKNQPRLATSVCRLRHDPMEQDPTEPHTGRGTFLLSSGGAGVWCLVSAVPGTDSTGRTGYGCPGRAGLDGATPRRAQRPSRRSRLPHVLPHPPRRPPR